MSEAKVGQYRIAKHGTKPWCYGMWFVAVINPTYPYKSDAQLYVSKKGIASVRMQSDVLDGNGGTYFLTQQEAQEVADVFNKHHSQFTTHENTLIDEVHDIGESNATKDEDDQSNTKETTNKTKDTKTKTIKRKVKRTNT